MIKLYKCSTLVKIHFVRAAKYQCPLCLAFHQCENTNVLKYESVKTLALWKLCELQIFDTCSRVSPPNMLPPFFVRSSEGIYLKLGEKDKK